MAAALLAPEVAGALGALADPFLITNSIAVPSPPLDLMALLPLAVVTLGALVLVALTVSSRLQGLATLLVRSMWW